MVGTVMKLKSVTHLKGKAEVFGNRASWLSCEQLSVLQLFLLVNKQIVACCRIISRISILYPGH